MLDLTCMQEWSVTRFKSGYVQQLGDKSALRGRYSKASTNSVQLITSGQILSKKYVHPGE